MQRAIFIWLCLLGSMLRLSAAPQIPVTHTWGDLFSHAPITVDYQRPGSDKDKKPFAPEKISVWIGIDRAQTVPTSGALLYCAVRRSNLEQADDDEDTLGPFEVKVDPPYCSVMHCKFQRLRRVTRLLNATFVLAAKSVPISSAGTYTIQLTPRYRADRYTAPKALATVRLEVSGEAASPWLAWREPDEENAAEANPQTDATSAQVLGPSDRVAIPNAGPDVLSYPAAPGNEVVLPQLTPDAPDAKTRLIVEGNTLVLKAEHLDWFEPENRCLSRWWINGKPFVLGLRQAEEQSMVARSVSAAEPAGTPSAACFEWELQPELLGAKKGDKIGVQLLYCPLGCTRAEGGQTELLLSSRANDRPAPASYSLLSNRIDFTYSGDPKKPIQP